MLTTGLQTAECGEGEHCLLYQWRRSAHTVARLRQCVPVRLVLGPVHHPLAPAPHCHLQDITEDRSAGILACLCTSDLCNTAPRQGEPGRTGTDGTEIKASTARAVISSGAPATTGKPSTALPGVPRTGAGRGGGLREVPRTGSGVRVPGFNLDFPIEPESELQLEKLLKEPARKKSTAASGKKRKASA